MSTFNQFLYKIFSGLEAQEQREEDYLAQSVDAADLERRIHELEYGGADHAAFPSHTTSPEVPTWGPLW